MGEPSMNTSGVPLKQGLVDDVISSASEVNAGGSSDIRGSVKPISFDFDKLLNLRALSSAAV